MSLLETAVRRPVTLTVVVLLIVLFGVLSLRTVPVQLTPNVDQPVLTVTTRWFGAEPEEIVREIVEKQEEVLKAVTGLQEMTSQARTGEGSIRLEFSVGVDREAALNEVRDKLSQVAQYPRDADRPIIDTVDAASRDYIAWIVVRPAAEGVVPSDGTNAPGFSGDIRELGTFFEDEVKPILERAEGVGQIQLLGGREREVQVRVDLAALAARGLTVERLIAVLQDANRDVTAGTIDEGKRSASVRVTGQYDDVGQVAETLVGYTTQGAPVYVGDVARVAAGFKKEVGFVRSQGTPTMAINAQRETGSNVLTVMENLKAAIADVNENVLAAQGWGIELHQVYDQTIYINDAVGQAVRNLLLGAVLAAAVLLVTLRSIGATLVIVTAIPIATIGTFLGMALLGRSLNVISMAGLTFAVGMGIDNAIVVLENIFRHREMGKDRFKAAIDGASEVVGAIVASTLTNVAVFLPVVFIQEEAGQLFRDMSIALTCSFFLYLFVAPTVIPMLTTILLRGTPGGFRKTEERARGVRRVFGAFGTATAAFNDGFYRLIYRLTGGLAVRVGLVTVLLVGATSAAWFLMPPRDYLPSGNQNLIFGILAPPPGYNVNEVRQMAEQVESVIRPWWQVGQDSDEHRALQAGWTEMVQTQMLPQLEGAAAGRRAQMEAQGTDPADVAAAMAPMEGQIAALRSRPPPPAIDNFFMGSFGTFVFMGAASADGSNVASLEGVMNASIQGIPGTFGFFQQSPIFRTGDRFGTAGISVDLVGSNADQVLAAAGAVQGMLMQQFNTFPRAEPSNFNLGRPEIRVRPDRARAGAAGITDAAIRTSAQVAVDGAIVGEFRDAGRAIDLTVVSDAPRDSVTGGDLAQVPLAARDGRVLPLAGVASIVETSAPQQINRTEEQTSVTLTVNLPPTVTVGEAAERVREGVEKPLRAAGVIPPGVRMNLGGSAGRLDAFMGAFLPGFVLAALITYLLLAALLENFIYPLVIILSVPFAMAGGFIGLAILHAIDPSVQLDVLTMLGFVILIGTIVNNPILIVYLALESIRRGVSPRKAIARSTQIRVRPIFMSVVTTVAGLSPLVIFAGAGSELYRGLGAVIIGGLLLSAFLTLFLTPTLLSLMIDTVAGVHSAAGRSADLVRNVLAGRKPQRSLAYASGSPPITPASTAPPP